MDSIINNLIKKTNNISCDLTGGLDSRTMFSLLINSNIDFNKIEINSRKNEKEDYEIASTISNDLNFELNKKLNIDYDYINSIDDALTISFYTKLGFKKAYYHTI